MKVGATRCVAHTSFSCDGDVNSSLSPWMNSFGFVESNTARKWPPNRMLANQPNT